MPLEDGSRCFFVEVQIGVGQHEPVEDRHRMHGAVYTRPAPQLFRVLCLPPSNWKAGNLYSLPAFTPSSVPSPCLWRMRLYADPEQPGSFPGGEGRSEQGHVLGRREDLKALKREHPRISWDGEA